MAWIVTKKSYICGCMVFQRQVQAIEDGDYKRTHFCNWFLWENTQMVGVGAILIQDILLKYPFMIRRLVCH
jgi:hypothetical protein